MRFDVGRLVKMLQFGLMNRQRLSWTKLANIGFSVIRDLSEVHEYRCGNAEVHLSSCVRSLYFILPVRSRLALILLGYSKLGDPIILYAHFFFSL